MSLSKLALAVIGTGAIGVALVGTGAGATFTDAVHSTQTVTAGSTNLVMWSADAADSACQNAPTSANTACKSITLKPVGPLGSTFETTPSIVYVANMGNIPVTFDAFQLAAKYSGSASNALVHQTDVCIQSKDASGGPWTEGRGPLAAALTLNPTVKENGVVLQPISDASSASVGGHTAASFSFSFYAGQDSTHCTSPASGEYSDGPHTNAAWTTANGGSGYSAPASLTNAAEGGSFSATLTLSVTG